jgi:hypothetical protein
MIETYRRLGREHEADLAREATRRQQASLARPAAGGGASGGSGLSLIGHVRVWARFCERGRNALALRHANDI